MSKKRPYVPAISREVEFICKNVPAANAIYFEQIRVPQPIAELTRAVSDHADAHVDSLLLALKAAVSERTKGVVRIKWTNTNRGAYWRIYGTVYKVHGKKKLGLGGVFLPCHYSRACNLVGWFSPLGGLHGRKMIARACLGKLNNVKVVSEHPKEFKGWPRDEDYVIWFDEELTLTTARDELCHGVGQRAKAFFKIVKRLM